MSIAPAKPSRARATFALALVFAAGFAGAGFDCIGRRRAACWLLAAIVIALLFVLGSWGGTHVTTALRRRIALLARRRRGFAVPAGEAPERVAALVRVAAPSGARAPDWLPLSLVASYLDRYGVRCAAVRAAFHSFGDGGQEAWITLVVDARENLAALRARNARIELRELAEAARRRLAAQLREAGFAADHADDAPSLAGAGVEDWNGVVEDGERVGAYAVSTAGDLDARLAAIAEYPAQEIWTVLEFTGAAQGGQRAAPSLAAACALRKKGPVELLPAGLRPHRGAHLPVLAALSPGSTSLLPRRAG
ncbi:MAG: type VII secretion protein EccE [Segniliparus sp.]|uniref:type VII secretion protein EccE n=1 Tax=Segniliparus sp. TaxID=2804064 RepID=UPI003F2ED290